MSRAERITINILITLVGLAQYKKPKVKVNLIPGKLKQVGSKIIFMQNIHFSIPILILSR